MSLFQDILGAVFIAVRKLADANWSDFKSEAIKDGEAFVNETRADLELWTGQLARGELTKEEFQFLLGAKRDLATLEALKQEGLAVARLTEFRNDLVDTVVGAVVAAIPGLPPPPT